MFQIQCWDWLVLCSSPVIHSNKKSFSFYLKIWKLIRLTLSGWQRFRTLISVKRHFTWVKTLVSGVLRSAIPHFQNFSSFSTCGVNIKMFSQETSAKSQGGGEDWVGGRRISPVAAPQRCLLTATIFWESLFFRQGTLPRRQKRSNTFAICHILFWVVAYSLKINPLDLKAIIQRD